MAHLIYSAITSLDGYIEDKEGGFDWAMPDEEVHAFINNLERNIGTYLLGRKMYEVMKFWESLPKEESPSPIMLDYAQIWQSADKIIFSRSLQEVSTHKTQIVRNFDAETIQRIKTESRKDISIGGPGLAANAIQANLVDEFQIFVFPVMVGGGKAAFPDKIQLNLELKEELSFGSGVVYLSYENYPSGKN